MPDGTTGMKFWSNGKGEPQVSNFGHMVRGDHRHEILVKCKGGTTGIKYCSNGKGGPHASNLGQMVRGDHRHQIWVK